LIFEQRIGKTGQHKIKILVDPRIKILLSNANDTTICIPSVKRTGPSKPNLLLKEEERRVVLVFVERHESKYYKDLIKENNKHFLVVLPENWIRYGCRVVRQVIKSVVETLHPGLYCQMDDDCIGVKCVDDQGNLDKTITIMEMVDILERDMKNEPTAILCCQPARNLRYSKRKLKNKEKSNTKRAEKLVLFNPEFTRDVHYAPPVVFDLVGMDILDEKLRAAIRQGEDFGMCYQLGISRCKMYLMYYLKEQNTASRNKTQNKQDAEEQHKMLFKVDEEVHQA